MKIPKKYQKYKVQSNKTWTTHVIEFWNKRQLQDTYTPAHKIKRGNIHKKNSWETPQKHLYLRLLPSSTGMHINTWLILEVSHTNTTPRENLKQHPGIYSRNYHHLGRHHIWIYGKGTLCPSVIWHLRRHRMELQVKLWWGQIVSTSYSCKKASNHCNRCRNMHLWKTLQRNIECHRG